MKSESFLQRWARLKHGGQAPEQPGAGKDASDTQAATAELPAAATEQEMLPTLEAAARLRPDSDYSAFLAKGVDKAVRRMALKRLFSDPHFNMIDGLDIYMGDYNRSEPVSAAMLGALQQAQGFLQQVAAEAEKGTADKRSEKDGPPAVAGTSAHFPGKPS